MTDSGRGTIDQQIDELGSHFSAALDKMATGTFVRDGIVRQAINSVIWDIYHTMPDQRGALAEALEDMESVVRSAAAEDDAKAAQQKRDEEAEPKP